MHLFALNLNRTFDKLSLSMRLFLAFTVTVQLTLSHSFSAFQHVLLPLPSYPYPQYPVQFYPATFQVAVPAFAPVVIARISKRPEPVPASVVLEQEQEEPPFKEPPRGAVVDADNGAGTCVTRKGLSGTCRSRQDCYGIFHAADAASNDVRDEIGIIPRSLNLPVEESEPETGSSGEIYFQPDSSSYQFSDTLLDEIYNTSKSGDSCGAEEQVCCPIQGTAAVEETSADPQFVTNNEQEHKEDTLQLRKDSKAKVTQTCGERKVILRVRRITVGGSPKITGGTMATRGEFPWMVAIFGVSGKQTCGGSLISNNYVLTAAHCLSTYNANDVAKLKVNIGDHNLHTTADGMHETRGVSKIFVHKGFSLSHFADDIALMKLDRPVTYNDYIQPICLPPPTNSSLFRGDLEGKKVIVTGWGRERSHGSLSPVLRKVEVPIWRHAECQRIYKIFAPSQRLTDTHICAGDGKKSKDACVGDSGGPLVFNAGSKWYQLGIVSWGKGCGSFPGVYTRIDKYIPWIMKNMA